MIKILGMLLIYQDIAEQTYYLTADYFLGKLYLSLILFH